MTALEDEGESDWRTRIMFSNELYYTQVIHTHTRHEWLYDVYSLQTRHFLRLVLRGQSSISFGEPWTWSFYEPTAVRHKSTITHL